MIDILFVGLNASCTNPLQLVIHYFQFVIHSDHNIENTTPAHKECAATLWFCDYQDGYSVPFSLLESVFTSASFIGWLKIHTENREPVWQEILFP